MPESFWAQSAFGWTAVAVHLNGIAVVDTHSLRSFLVAKAPCGGTDNRFLSFGEAEETG